MDTEELTRRVLAQRMSRYPDPGPSLAPFGSARFRQESGRLRVGFAAVRSGYAGEAVARVLQAALARHQQVQWVVVPQRAGEEELPRALAEAGFQLTEDLRLMAHEGLVHLTTAPHIDAEPIASWQTMWNYEYGSRQAFFDDPAPPTPVVTQRARDRWREQEHGWCRYYAAMFQGEMVGGCYVSLFEDVPTIMGVYTVPRARHRGAATALIARAVADTVRPGREYCCLFVRHGNPAERLYRKLGFVTLADECTYSAVQG